MVHVPRMLSEVATTTKLVEADPALKYEWFAPIFRFFGWETLE